MQNTSYAVKVQRSLAPLSWFPGSRKPTAHVHKWCRFQSYAKSRRLHAIANEIYKRNLHCVNHIPGIHDNGPPRTTLWRLTLTANCESSCSRLNIACEYCLLPMKTQKSQKSIILTQPLTHLSSKSRAGGRATPPPPPQVLRKFIFYKFCI